ncbi:hypothetical protein AB0N07_01275 [Streptomyces sp. NPDC051172]|uniref:hypothetical protein n=1 Tax=Streptomyces sp. NPDC051172 TaxID=3155796 RepID=UPI00343865FE
MSHLPPMHTAGELRAALTMGYGFSGVARLVEEFRGRGAARQDIRTTRLRRP